MATLTKLERLIRKPLPQRTYDAAFEECMKKADDEVGLACPLFWMRAQTREGKKIDEPWWASKEESEDAFAIATGQHDKNKQYPNISIVLARLIYESSLPKMPELSCGDLDNVRVLLREVQDIQSKIEKKELQSQIGEAMAREIATREKLFGLMKTEDRRDFIARFKAALEGESNRLRKQAIHRARQSGSK